MDEKRKMFDTRVTSRYEIESYFVDNVGMPPEDILEEVGNDPDRFAEEIANVFEECEWESPLDENGFPLDPAEYARSWAERYLDES